MPNLSKLKKAELVKLCEAYEKSLGIDELKSENTKLTNRIKELEKSLKQSQQQERIAKFAMKGKTQTELKVRWDNMMNR